MKKNTGFILILFLLISQLSINILETKAIPAYPFPIKFEQPDGSRIDIQLKGDEKVKWAETIDGYSILFNKNGTYEYALQNVKGDMIPSGKQARNQSDRSNEDNIFLSKIQKGLKYSSSQISLMKTIWNIQKNEAQRVFPTTGNRNLICILIGFTDLAFTKTQAEFNNLFNQLNYTTDGATGSVKDYYNESSYGQLNLTVTVAGPFTAANNMAYYGANDINGNDAAPQTLAAEAVNLANSSVNYANFDNDADGYVDGVYIIYAGYGEEAGASSNAIWAHAWNLSLTLYLDGKYISKYSCSPELRGSSGTGITRIGVICHEFGHVLGAPDFYDTDYSTGGQYDGTGYWDMMASGSWNNNGTTPAHHNVYTKTKVYNWAVANILNSGTVITLNNAEQNNNSFYQFNTTTANEYFLIENRQQQLFDAYIPGKGMLIYHVDENYINTAGNDINAGIHQGMYPVCANATGNPTTTYGTINGTACTFPGSGLKTSFTDATTPWAKSWAGANTSKPITSITENTSNKTVTFSFMGGSSCTAPTNQATNFSISNLLNTSLTVNWTRGNGNNVIVLAKAGSAVDTDPVSGTTYMANSVFGNGNQTGTGNYVVYNGSGTNVNITGLTQGVTYYFSVYEYATSATCYLIPGLIGNATTLCGTITSFPYSESFTASTIPTCYTQQNTGTGLTDMWAISASNSAGGSVNEIRAIYQNINPGTSRLILNPINTIGIRSLTLNFKHFFDDYGIGCYYKIQTSTDKINWTDAGWTFSSGSGNAGPTSVSLSINQNMNSTTTYIAFVLDGNLYYLDYWYIDDINITGNQAVSANLNVSTTSLPSFGNVNQNNSSSRQYFGISASGLSSNVIITAPNGFLVSTNCNSAFSSSATLTAVNGIIPYTKVWVKFNPAGLGASSGNISISATGVTTKTVAVSGTCVAGAIPANYYSTATGNGALLKNQLHNIIKVHNKRTYTNLWTDFQSTDKKYNGKVWDMYSDKPCDSNYEFTFATNQCGTYSAEAGCYNREHSLPNSWWGGSTSDSMYTDLNTLVPTDGYVNNMRSNYTFGNVAIPNWTSTNGSKRGPCTYPGYNGNQTNVFEPIDEYKGDFARIYFYMATRYESRISSWPANDANAADCFAGNTYPGFKTWQLNLLLEWHNNDPVSQKEINRNNAVYSIQGNRNPFIDNPEYAALIWQSTPVVNTLPASSITSNSVVCNGNILSGGSSAINESGIIYSTTPNPVIGGSGVIKLSSSPLITTGNFSINITELIPLTTYYARAYAINSQGTSYGTDIMFTTEAYLPILTTDSIKNITATSASAYCKLNQNLYGKMQFTGIVFSEDPNPFAGDPGVTTLTTNPSDTIADYIINLINLSPGTIYYLKAYASNDMGVSYGDEISFTTLTCITQALPYTQNFETTFPPAGWSVINPDENKTWANKLVAGKQSGTDSAAYMNFYSYTSTYLGQTDDLISPAFDFTTATNPKLIFNVAYRYYSLTSTDTLKIYYSTDCGGTYSAIPVYVKGGTELSTGGQLMNNFTPTSSSDWRQEKVDLGFLAGNNNVKLKFQAVNDYGNNLYIDDIQIIPDGLMKPTVFTYNATVLNADTVILYGRVNPNGLPTSVQFNYGTSISYSNIITAVPNNVNGENDITVYQYLIGLPTNSTFNYQVSATNSLGTTSGNNVVFQTPCTTFSLPLIENFDNPQIPNCWTVQNSSGLTDKWTISATTNAGGNANELKSTYQMLNGTTRFVSPAINTIGKNLLKLSFKHFFDDFSTGANIKIQSSTDAINWSNENFSFSSGNGNITSTDVITQIYNNLNSLTTYIAFVISDSLGKYDYWYIDNIRIEQDFPTPNFIANKTNICINDSIIFYNLSQGPINSYLWNFGNDAIPQTATGSGPHIVKYLTSGLKNISLTLDNLITSTKNNYISINSLAIGGSITGNGNICIGQSTGNILLNNYNGNILKWQKRLNGNNWVDIQNSNNSFEEIPVSTGIWDYRAEVSNLSCNTVFSDIYSIEVYNLPIAGNVTASSNSICYGNTCTLLLDSYLGNIQWEQSINGTGNWTEVNTGSGFNSNIFTTSPISSSMYYRAKVTLNNCSATYSNAIYILMNGNPIPGTASATINSICNSGNTTLNLNGSSGSVQWESSSDSISWNPIIGANNPVYNVISLTQTTYFRAKVYINTCYVYSNTLKINISPVPAAGTISVQGSPMCGGNSAVLTLNNSVGNIQWLQSPNGSGNWTDVISGSGYNSPVFTTSNLYSTTYFRAKLSSGICGVVYSQISNVFVYPQVVGGIATANNNVCSGNSTAISLSGSSGNIIWQQTTDTNSAWQNVTGGSGNNTTSYTTPLLTTSVFYRAKLSGTLCPDAYSNIIAININSPSIAGEINSANPNICEGNTANLSLSSYNGNIQWQQSANGIDNWTDLINGIGYNSDTYTSTQLSISVYFRAKVTNGSCASINTDPFLINVDMMPLAGSISPIIQSLCYGNNTTISLTNSFGNIQWQESSDGNNWNDINGLNGSGINSTVYSSPALYSNTFYRAKLTNGSCTSVNSSVSTINITPLPNAGVATAGNNNFCSGGSSSLSLTNYTGNIQWQQSIDSINWSNVTNGNGSTTANYTTTALNQTTFFRAQLTSGSCNNYSNIVKINVYPLAVAGTINVSGSPMCAGNSATLTLNNSTGSVQWLQSPTGSGNWTNVVTGNGYNTVNLQTANLSATTYFRARLTSGNCPVVFSPISNVFVYNQPIGGNITASATQICASGTSTLTLSSFSGNIIWEQSADSANWVNASGGSGSNTANYTTPVLTSKRYYRAKLSNGICTPAYSNVVSINVNGLSIAGNITVTEDTICQNSAVELQTTANQGEIQWQYSDNSIDWNDISGAISSVYQSGLLTNSLYYRSKITNGTCAAAYSNSIYIKVDEQTIAGNLSLSEDTLCYGSLFNLNLTAYNGNISWQQSSDAINWQTINNQSTANYNDVAFANKYFRTIVSNGVCPQLTSNEVYLVVNEELIGGVAEGSKTICFGNSTQNLILKNYSGNITKWQKNYNNSNWTDINHSDSIYSETPDSVGIWIYRAVLDNYPCQTVYSEAANIHVISSPNAGSIIGSKNICYGSSTDTLTSDAQNQYIVKWQKRLNEDIWTDIPNTNQQNQYEEIPLTSGKWEYRIVVSNSVCDTVFSSYATINVFATPNAGILSGSKSICFGSNTDTLKLTNYNSDIIKWQKRFNSNDWIDFANIEEKHIETPSETGKWDYRVLISNSICDTAYSSIATIIVNPLPIIYAGNDTTIYAGEGIQLTANGGDNYTWNNNLLQSITFYPESSSEYIVKGIDNNSCINYDTISVFVKNKILSLKLFFEGLYIGNNLMHPALNNGIAQWGNEIADKITVELTNANAPYNTIFIDTNVYLGINGIANVKKLPYLLNGEYYIVIKSRNHIETWSSLAVSFANDTTIYDFSISSDKAFGNNLKQIVNNIPQNIINLNSSQSNNILNLKSYNYSPERFTLLFIPENNKTLIKVIIIDKVTNKTYQKTINKAEYFK